MNLLPFTSIMLIILTIVSLSFFRSHTDFKSQASVLCNFFDAERDTRNTLATREYRKRAPKKKKDPTDVEKKPPAITRPKENFTYTAKINLAHINIPAIKHAALSLLTSLYTKAPVEFSPETFLNELPKQLSTVKEWTELVPFELQKGTQRAYPPITKFFYYNEKKEPLYFRKAAPEVIEAYFGKKLSETIFRLEEKASTLTLEELETLTRKHDGLCFKVLKPRNKTVSKTTKTVTVVR
ncbi:MAG: hypothetical protein SP1CHLAM54_13840 [Chlamydiia bacterium]|nr:hypothetical protein [Chlamydiia bacterium]MCH9616277.1 hypothetical protein [Chlamydiia bacterium]MCH9629737.1 hypothetical protein [Chlamydiia bacterium]